MWLSSQAARPRRGEPAASIGEISISGESLGVVTAAEKRDVPVAAPGGYLWRPKAGDSVLVIKSAEGEELVSASVSRKLPADLGGGDIRLVTDGAQLQISNGGDIVIRGNIKIEGELTINGAPYIPFVTG